MHAPSPGHEGNKIFAFFFFFPIFFPISFHLGGYSDCLPSTSWRTRTTHLTQVHTDYFLICLFGVERWCCKLSHSGTGFGYAGYIINNRRAVTVGSVSLSGIDYLSSGAESYSKRKSIEWLDPKDLLLLLSTFQV